MFLEKKYTKIEAMGGLWSNQMTSSHTRKALRTNILMVTWDSFAQGVSPNHFTRTVDLSRRAGADALSFCTRGFGIKRG